MKSDALHHPLFRIDPVFAGVPEGCSEAEALLEEYLKCPVEER